MPDATKAQLWQIHQRWLDGLADEAELSTLAEAIARDAQLADDIARQARLDAALGRSRQLDKAPRAKPRNIAWPLLLPWAALIVVGLSAAGWWLAAPRDAGRQALPMVLGGGSVLTIADGARLTTAPGAQVQILPEDGTIALAAGAIEIDGEGGRQKAAIRTPEVVVQRLGTHLLVQSFRGRTTVVVLRGSVRMARNADGRQVDLSAGQQADSSSLITGVELRTLWLWNPAAETPGALVLGHRASVAQGVVVQAEPYRGGKAPQRDRVIMEQEADRGGSAVAVVPTDACEVILDCDRAMRGNVILAVERPGSEQRFAPLVHALQFSAGPNHVRFRLADTKFSGSDPLPADPGRMQLKQVLIEGFDPAARLDLVQLRIARPVSSAE